ncbi:MAG TPA: hypothetical protein VL443_24210 [Cyclobacteriaceae bacterium]|jgi:hypothetical protein|nr:hypothetical protein [Cyclobacteriaceae bacterium]
MELNENILKEINKQLPQLAATELVTFIEDAKGTKKLLEVTQQNVKTMQAELSALREKESKFNNATKMMEDAEKLSKTADARQADMELTLTKEKLSQRDFVIQKFEGFLSLLVKNPRAIEMISGSENFSNSTYYDGSRNVREHLHSSTSSQSEKIETKD